MRETIDNCAVLRVRFKPAGFDAVLSGLWSGPAHSTNPTSSTECGGPSGPSSGSRAKTTRGACLQWRASSSGAVASAKRTVKRGGNHDRVSGVVSLKRVFSTSSALCHNMARPVSRSLLVPLAAKPSCKQPQRLVRIDIMELTKLRDQQSGALLKASLQLARQVARSSGSGGTPHRRA